MALARGTENVDRAITRLLELARSAPIEASLNIGRIVSEECYRGDPAGWRSRARKGHTLRELVRHPDLPISAAALFRALALHEMSHRLGGIGHWTNLSMSHFRAVFALSECEQRQLLQEANAGGWSVRELEETVAIRTQALAKRGGRPRAAPAARAVASLKKYIEDVEHARVAAEEYESLEPEQQMELLGLIELVRRHVDTLEHQLRTVLSNGK